MAHHLVPCWNPRDRWRHPCRTTLSSTFVVRELPLQSRVWTSIYDASKWLHKNMSELGWDRVLRDNVSYYLSSVDPTLELCGSVAVVFDRRRWRWQNAVSAVQCYCVKLTIYGIQGICISWYNNVNAELRV